MTPIQKLSVAELRQDFASLSITHPHFKWALDAFDELARRLEEARKKIAEQDILLRCSLPTNHYTDHILELQEQLKEAQGAMQPKKSPFEKYAAGEKLTHEEILALGSPEEAYALGLSRSAYLSTAEVSEEDKELLDKCNELLRLYEEVYGSAQYRVAAALKRRIEKEKEDETDS